MPSQTLCGWLTPPQIYKRGVCGCQKEKRQCWKEQSGVVQLWWKQSHPAEVFLCQRRLRGWGGKGGRGEKMLSFASRPASLKECWGRENWEVETFVGVQKEEIQLNYTRIECIFNHAASFPDVTVSLCAKLWGILWKMSCQHFLSLSMRPPLPEHGRPTTQYPAAAAGADMIRHFTATGKKNLISRYRSYVTTLFMSIGNGSASFVQKMWVSFNSADDFLSRFLDLNLVGITL